MTSGPPRGSYRESRDWIQAMRRSLCPQPLPFAEVPRSHTCKIMGPEHVTRSAPKTPEPSACPWKDTGRGRALVLGGVRSARGLGWDPGRHRRTEPNTVGAGPALPPTPGAAPAPPPRLCARVCEHACFRLSSQATGRDRARLRGPRRTRAGNGGT